MSFNFRSSPGSRSLQIVVFGDSLTKYLADDIAALDQNVKADVFCQRGATVASLSDAIEHDWRTLEKLNPDIVFVHVGTNTLQRQLVSKTVQQLKELCKLIQNLYPYARIAVNNILNRFDDYDLNDAGKWLNVQIRSFCSTIYPTCYPAFAGEDFRIRNFAGDKLHLNQDGYCQFAEEVLEECHRVAHITSTKCFPTSMIPPVFVKKTRKQKLQDRRKYLHESAERCRFTRPCLQEPRATTSTASASTKVYPAMHGPVVPILLPIHAGFYNGKNCQTKPKLLIPASTSPYVAKKKAVKKRRKQTVKAAKRRRRKRKRKVGLLHLCITSISWLFLRC